MTAYYYFKRNFIDIKSAHSLVEHRTVNNSSNIDPNTDLVVFS